MVDSNQHFTENSRCVHHEGTFIRCQHKKLEKQLTDEKLMLHAADRDSALSFSRRVEAERRNAAAQ
ncbi:MAG: hypothetical protein KGL35_02095 [Bradyrhizobium sp.]|nr:hypothetical protein [Bradyrhizobium sp.]